MTKRPMVAVLSIVSIFALGLGATPPASATSATGRLTLNDQPAFLGQTAFDTTITTDVVCRKITEADMNPTGFDKARSAANATDLNITFFSADNCTGTITTLAPNGTDPLLGGDAGAKSYKATALPTAG